MFFRKRPPRADVPSLALASARLRQSKINAPKQISFPKSNTTQYKVLLASSATNDSFGNKVKQKLLENGHEVDLIVPNTSHLFDHMTSEKKYDIVINAVHPVAYEFDHNTTDPLASPKARDKLFKSFLEVLGTVKPRAYIQHSSTLTRRKGKLTSIFDRDRLAIESSKKIGCELMILRFGIMYSATNLLTQKLVQGLHNRKICISGDGSNSVSVIHEHDAVNAVQSASELVYNQSLQVEKDKLENKPRTLPRYLQDVEVFRNQVEGKLLYGYDIVDNTVLTQAEFLLTLARTFGAPRDPPFGGSFVADLWMSRMSEYLEAELRGCNLEFQETCDWRPIYRNLKEGLEQVQEEWTESGWLEVAKKQTQQQPEPRGLLDRWMTKWRGTNAPPAQQ